LGFFNEVRDIRGVVSRLPNHIRRQAQPGGLQMTERIIEEHVHTGGGGSGAITALAVVLFLLVLLAVLYFSGTLGRMFGGTQKHEIDINVNKPGIVLQLR
jgi:hypothetical protein